MNHLVFTMSNEYIRKEVENADQLILFSIFTLQELEVVMMRGKE